MARPKNALRIAVVLLLLPSAALAQEAPTTAPPTTAPPTAAPPTTAPPTAAPPTTAPPTSAPPTTAPPTAAPPTSAPPPATPPAAAPPPAAATPPDEAAKKDDDDKSKLIIGLDGHLIGAIEDGEEEIGSGLELRVGWHKTHLLGLLFVRPELGGGFDRILANNMGRIYGGARLGLQFVVAAYLYGHGGYGWGAPDAAFTYDVGVGADLVLFSVIRPGVHFDYMEILDNVQTVRGGIHLELAF